MSKQMNIPKLRFPEFSEEWKKTPLVRVFDKVVVGFVGTVSNFYCNKEEGVQFIRTLNVREGRFSQLNLQYVTREFHNKNKKSQVNNGDILIARVGANMGMVCEINGLNGEANSANVIIIKQQSNINSGFYSLYLTSSKGQKQIMSLGAGGAQEVLNISVAKLIKVPIISLPEQQKIASFLTAVDDKIEQLTKKKSLLEQYKKGVMQQIFTQQLRFKKEDGTNYPDWEEKRLGKIGTTLNGLTGKTKENFGTGKPYVQYKQIFDSSKIDINKCGLVDIEENETQTKVKYGDVFFTTSSETPNEIGTASVLLNEVEEMYLNSFCFGYRVDAKILNPHFSQFLFRSANFRRKMMPLAQGSTRYNISKSSFVKLLMELPCIEEQTQIANFLSAIDDRIALVNTQLENTQQFKKGLLQQMFV